MNYKGGTGKTSTVVNLAHGLALQGQKVLVIDTDPQGSSGYHLGINTDGAVPTLYDLLIQGKSPRECIVNAREGIDIICSNERLFPAEMALSKEKDREFRLQHCLENLTGYDYVLVDCPPSMNLLNQNSLLYANDIYLPVSMEYLSLVGVKQLLSNIGLINSIFKANIQVSKVIPTFYDKRNTKSKEIVDSLNRVFPGLISSPIGVSVAISEAAGVKQTVFEYDASSKGAQDYLQLTKEVLSHG